MTLSNDQFSDDVKGWYSMPDGRGTTRYVYMGASSTKRADPFSEHETITSGKGVQIVVNNQEEIPNFGPKWAGEPDTWGDVGVEEYTGRSSSELFKHSPAEAYSVFASKEMRPHVMTGLAIANERAYPGGSRALSFPDSLSVHSSSLVNNLRNRGMQVDASFSNTSAEVTNDYTFDDAFKVVMHSRSGATRIAPEEISMAKKNVRSILGRPVSPPVSKPPAQQGEQMRLF